MVVLTHGILIDPQHARFPSLPHLIHTLICAVGNSAAPMTKPDPIQYTFVEPALLEQALTHASVGRRHNERLEFLGDAVLDLVVVENLFKAREDLPEGELTVRKSHVVSRPSLAVAADELELPGRTKVSRGLDRENLSAAVKAGLYEAVVGAIYLDGGLEAAVEFIQRTLSAPLSRARSIEGVKIPKQGLQELAQTDGGDPPTYEILEETGEAHAPRFSVRARLGDRCFSAAWGSTLKEAESLAAQKALHEIEFGPDASGSLKFGHGIFTGEDAQ